jgi:hypothetical protein
VLQGKLMMYCGKLSAGILELQDVPVFVEGFLDLSPIAEWRELFNCRKEAE